VLVDRLELDEGCGLLKVWSSEGCGPVPSPSWLPWLPSYQDKPEEWQRRKRIQDITVVQ